MVQLQGEASSVDVWAFEPEAADLIERSGPPERFAAVADLYREELMPGHLCARPAEEAIAAARERMHQMALRLVEAYSRLTNPGAPCEAFARKLLATDPVAEEAHRALIRCALHDGRSNRARRLFDQCRELLSVELGVEPEPETLELAGALGAGAAPARDVTCAPEAESPTLSRHEDLPPPGVPAPGPKRPNGVAPNVSARPALVVLPFEARGDDEAFAIAHGIVEELACGIARMRNCDVIARQSAYAYKDRFVDARTIGQQLGVGYIVDGALNLEGPVLRLHVQLVDARSAVVIWSRRYDERISNAIDLQQSVASQIAGALAPGIRRREIELVGARPLGDLDVYGLVLRAYPQLWTHRRDGNASALSLLDRALEIDPGHCLALSLKSWLLAMKVCYLWSGQPERERASSLELADRAAQNADDDPTALAALAATYSLSSADLHRAAFFVASSLEADPCNAWGWMRKGWLHAIAREPAEAIAAIDRAQTLSPIDPFLFNCYFGRAMAESVTGNFAAAADLVRGGINRSRGAVWAYRMLASFCCRAGDMDGAREAVDRFRQHHPTVTISDLRRCLPPALVAGDQDHLVALAALGLPD
ncbi:BTAD domain-containing putative transcriptional regulator [Salinarimonas sp.]|uniref:BTAD domain-containing putative transcriptional regulator n=1 Tax=Salinarimonas sp. TaxID=2766526 RepID=UPI0032D9673F